ncbi:D-ribose pyranase [Treponema sp. OttesenSCG-928-L16]|nr:D-ribose pyranase [Treponema sp. OttesenSCG-928-L16]
MKRGGILNSGLSAAVSRLGHGDMILIGDVGCAFPEKETVEVIDLAVSNGIPLVSDVLSAVLEELVVESYILAEESLAASPQAVKKLEKVLSGFQNKNQALPRRTLPHAELKRLWLGGEQMKVFVRTGEHTPWGYIMLVAGVSF